jgi:hypothetical protein
MARTPARQGSGSQTFRKIVNSKIAGSRQESANSQ